MAAMSAADDASADRCGAGSAVVSLTGWLGRGTSIPMFYRPDAARRAAHRHPQRPRAAAPDRLDLDPRCRGPRQPRPLLVLQRRGLPPAAGDVRRDRPHEHGGFKDSFANIEATREFVVNLATWELREAVNASSIGAPHGFDEFAHAGLAKAARDHGQAIARRREPRPPRMRPLADRRARIPRPRPARTDGHRPGRRRAHRRRTVRRRPGRPRYASMRSPGWATTSMPACARSSR